MNPPLISVKALRRVFSTRGFRPTHKVAVDDLSFELHPGESLGLVGESGSGKSTTARIVCGLDSPTSGTVSVAGYDLSGEQRPPRAFYDDVQLIFQDPYLSLNPRMTVADSVGYRLRVKGVSEAERRQRVQTSLSTVGLPLAIANRYPHQLSTGQRQRVGIARAILGNPKIIVADEPVSSLDVSLQAQVLNLLIDIQEQTNVAYLFISHDLSAVGYLCNRMIVMQAGHEVEAGDTQQILETPRREYTRLLVAAAELGTTDSAVGHRPSSAVPEAGQAAQ
jgi:peptide/nickel transport system ATP-binding protein